MNDLMNFNEIFKNEWLMIILKFTKKQESTIPLADTFLKNAQEWTNCPSALLGLRIFP